MGWRRYAIYWLPDGALGRAGAAWLGWDARNGLGLTDAMAETDRPRRYGFHATIKPPFHLRDDLDDEALRDAAHAMAADLSEWDLGGLRVTRLGRTLVLIPDRTPCDLAGHVVAALDGFRAPPAPEELERRRAGGLTAKQDALLRRWGYPYVFDEFRMHLTLTGPDPSDARLDDAHSVFAPYATPIVMDKLSLVGEAADGYFHLIADLPLGGGA